jgi:CRISPR-associated endonuclease/helicase Cas3
MRYERLLAKSARGKPGDPDYVRPQTIRQHTAEVMATAARLVEVTGEAQLRAVGLDPQIWLTRLEEDILLCALLHDIGKANDHFQRMVQADHEDRPQDQKREAEVVV